jgi:putative hydrolase of HD superfamily
MEHIANFLFEVGMLKRTPRTGLQFLGSGKESVAEHVFRVVFIGYALAHLEQDVDENRVLKMCFLHDLPES